MLSIIIGLLSLGIIVLVHELGHYVFAIYYKVQVEEFAIGIGPKIIALMWKNTLWSIRILPLGGFCRMKSPNMRLDDPHTTIPQEQGTLNAISFRGKALVLLGGPLANIILFILFSLILYGTGGKNYDVQAYIDIVSEPSLSSELQQGDLITQINDTPIQSYTHMAKVASNLKGQTIQIQYTRNNISYNTSLTLNPSAPALGVIPYIAPIVSNEEMTSSMGLQYRDLIVEINSNPISNAVYLPQLLQTFEQNIPMVLFVIRDGEKIKLETLIPKQNATLDIFGIEYDTVLVRSWNSIGEFINVRTNEAVSIAQATATFFLDLLRLRTKHLSEQTAGPIRLVSIIGGNTLENASEYGWLFALIKLINNISLLSLAIASLNLLPLPILDGGQLLFYSVYRIRNKQPTIRAHMRYNFIGMIILLTLFGFIIFSDIMSFF